MKHSPISRSDVSARDEMAQSWPFFIILSFVMIAGYVNALNSVPSLRAPARRMLFTVLMLVHTVLYWLGPYLARTKRRLVIYCLVQGVLAFSINLLIVGHWLVWGIYPPLAGLVVAAFWPDWWASGLAAVICFALLAFNTIVSSGFEEFLQTVPFIVIMLTFVLVYVILFVRQAGLREQAQRLLSELEEAHQQLQEYADRVKELTISQERERMAQELHDTLAQGLAGLIMQLEAVDSHLENEDAVKAQRVVQQAMQRARTTLDEARRAIRALRPAALEQGSLIDALGREVDNFAETTGIQSAFEVETGPLDVSSEMAQDILRIVQESLSNVVRHAEASHVLVRLARSDEALQVVVQDDGVGFNLRDAEKLDRFGLAGMEERAQRLGGVLRVEGERGKGTVMTLEVGGAGE